MFYRFLRYIIPPFTFRVYFRRIFCANLKKVPKDKPLILATNHPNSFMDGILTGSYLGQPIHFLMRADMFKNALFRWCLKHLHVAPVYRIQEGLEHVHKNVETFAGVYDLFAKNENIHVAVEGITIMEKRLQNLKKGTARMAFGAEESHDHDVYVVPVALNYTHPSRFRKEVMISFHDPIRIKDFKEEYVNNKAKALLSFNRKLEAALRKEVIIIENKKDDWLTEKLFEIFRNNNVISIFIWKTDSDDRRIMEKNISEKINYLSKESDSEIEHLNNLVKGYTEKLKINKIDDKNLARKLNYGFLRYFILVLGFPVFLFGYLSNIVPFTIPKYICDSKIRDPKFYSAANISIGTGIYIVYFPIILIIAGIFAGWWGLLAGLFVPVTGYLVLFYKEVFWERINTIRFNRLKKKQASLVEELLGERKKIIDFVENIKPDSRAG